MLIFLHANSIDQIMAPGPHVHTHEPHTAGEEHPTARHNPPTRDCPEERPFSRLTRPETLHLTRSSLNFKTKDGSWGRGKKHQHKPIPELNHPVTDTSASPKSASITIAHKHQLGSAGTDSEEGSEASLPSDYHTLPHDGAQHFHNQASTGHWRKAFTSTSDQQRHENGSSPSSPLLRSPPRSPPRRRSSVDLRNGTASGHSSTGKARGLRAAFTSVAGLIIHAACDGIAMGASSASQDEGLKLVVVAAIMIHKAPAAFGLCTLLLSRRLSRSDVRRAMAIFSLATPLGALLTYFTLSTLLNSATAASGDGTHPQSTVSPVSPKQVGSALTFSAGSFIYVALHAVHELASPSSDYELETSRSEVPHAPMSMSDEHPAAATMNGHGRGHGHGNDPESHEHTHTVIPKQTLGRFGRIVVLLIGAALPRGLQLIFGHGH